MGRFAPKDSDQVDENDSTLAVDGLIDLLPAQTEAEIEAALAVNTLGDLLPERQVDDEGLESVWMLTDSGEVRESDIQNAAAEFQRFAERFHLFATEFRNRQ
jgi:hypothetical protein